MSTILKARDLCKSYIIKKNQNNVLRNINFELIKGEFVAIMGPSGSGKSTLLYTISGMDKMSAGEVTFDGKTLSKLSHNDLAKLRLEKMGFIFQQMYMMKNLCIMDNIVLPAFQVNKKKRSEVVRKAEELMKKFDVIEIAENDITEVSGGQLQRACICRALINDPDVVFADEPTGSLNSKAADVVMDEIIKVNRENTSVLMTTHNVKVAARSDKVIYLVDGNIKGEFILGKYKDEEMLKVRENKLNIWLMNQGW